MNLPVARTAKGDEILFHIPCQTASRLDEMDLKFFGTSTSLASRAFALEHLPANHMIGILVQAKPGLSWDCWIHDAFGISLD